MQPCQDAAEVTFVVAFSNLGWRYIDTNRPMNPVADELNGRPRAIPGFRTPAEAFAELLLDGLSEDAEGSFASTD